MLNLICTWAQRTRGTFQYPMYSKMEFKQIHVLRTFTIYLIAVCHNNMLWAFRLLLFNARTIDVYILEKYALCTVYCTVYCILYIAKQKLYFFFRDAYTHVSRYMYTQYGNGR